MVTCEYIQCFFHSHSAELANMKVLYYFANGVYLYSRLLTAKKNDLPTETTVIITASKISEVVVEVYYLLKLQS